LKIRIDIHYRGRNSLTNRGIRITFEPLNMPYMIYLFWSQQTNLPANYVHYLLPLPPKNFIIDSITFRILKKTGKWLHEYKTENTQD